MLFSIILRLGEWDIEQNPDCEENDDYDCNPEVIFANVSRIIVHPEYKSYTKVNDIALLRMKQALPRTYTSHIMPICMPFSTELMHDSFTDKTGSVVGWGQNENGIVHNLKSSLAILNHFNLYFRKKPSQNVHRDDNYQQ